MTFQTSPIAGTRDSYDYNCDTRTTLQFPTLGSCTFDVASGRCTGVVGWIGPREAPICGGSGEYLDDPRACRPVLTGPGGIPTCRAITTTTTQGCL
jgi:hypothetical protein